MQRSARVTDEALEVVQAAAIVVGDGPAWLVETLWAEEGVGIVGGAPKCCKSWLALDLALSVASGTPARAQSRDVGHHAAALVRSRGSSRREPAAAVGEKMSCSSSLQRFDLR